MHPGRSRASEDHKERAHRADPRSLQNRASRPTTRTQQSRSMYVFASRFRVSIACLHLGAPPLRNISGAQPGRAREGARARIPGKHALASRSRAHAATNGRARCAAHSRRCQLGELPKKAPSGGCCGLGTAPKPPKAGICMLAGGPMRIGCGGVPAPSTGAGSGGAPLKRAGEPHGGWWLESVGENGGNAGGEGQEKGGVIADCCGDGGGCCGGVRGGNWLL